jgi:N4-gp56 family major capsid protein
MANEYTWTLDAPSGVFKNHALSSKIREAAVADSVFMPYVDVEPGYGKRKGENVTITRIKNIPEPTTAKFSENDQIPVDQFAVNTTQIGVSYWGRAIRYTEQSDLLSHFDITDKIQRKLKQQMQLVMDTGAAGGFKLAKVKFIPTSLTGGTFDTDGTPSTTATENLTVSHVKVIRDYMSDTLHVPGWRGGQRYVCLASTKALRGIKNDPEFMAWRQYSDPKGAFDNGKIGQIENIDFIEVNHTNALSNAKGSGSVLGEAVIFGDDAVAMAVVKDPELRMALPGNFGMQYAVAWVGMLDYGIIWDTANDGEARIVHITSQ